MHLIMISNKDVRSWKYYFPQDKFHRYLRNAMQKIESSVKSAVKSAKEIVMEYVQATERQDFQSARGYLKDNVSYVSPLNSFDRAEPYLKYNLHLYQTGQLVKFDIKKEFADGNDYCMLHEWKSQLVCVVSCRRGWENKFDQGDLRSTSIPRRGQVEVVKGPKKIV
jgi:hypothetical protein